MNSKVLPVFLVSLLCLVHVSKCWVATENAFIQDPALLEQGYACKSSNADLGLMKNEEVISLKDCSEARCKDGSISYTGCGVVGAGEGCHIVPQDLSKNFPECCETVKCGP